MVQTFDEKSTDDSTKLKTICVWAIQFIKLILVIGLGCIVKGNWTTIQHKTLTAENSGALKHSLAENQ